MYLLFLNLDYNGELMFAKKKYLRLLAEKNDLFGSFPDELITADKIDEIKKIPLVALGDVRNGNNLLAVLKVLATKKPDALCTRPVNRFNLVFSSPCSPVVRSLFLHRSLRR